MKNYIRDVIDRYIKHDYPAEVDRDFRVWLIDDERADEKDSELSQLWKATESATTPNYQHSLERMRELTGIKTRQKVHTLHTRLVIWKIGSGFADCRIRWLYLSGFTEQTGTGLVAGLYTYHRDAEYYFTGRHASDDQFRKYLAISSTVYGRQSLCLSGGRSQLQGET